VPEAGEQGDDQWPFNAGGQRENKNLKKKKIVVEKESVRTGRKSLPGKKQKKRRQDGGC